MLFMGDACNCNLHLGGGPRGSHRFTSIEKALSYLKRPKCRAFPRSLW